MLHPCNKRHSFIRAHTKPPQSCDERKPAPPNEEQFNAPTAGDSVMSPIAAVLTSRGNSRKRTATEEIKENLITFYTCLSMPLIRFSPPDFAGEPVK